MTREHLEALIQLHLTPALEALYNDGVGVVIIAAPLLDPADGKAVIGGSAIEDIADMETYLKAALKQVRGQGRTKPFKLEGN